MSKIAKSFTGLQKKSGKFLISGKSLTAKSKTVGTFEAKTHFSALIDEVDQQGNHVFITKHGRLIAKLIPATGLDRSDIVQTIQQIKEFNKYTLNGLDWKELRNIGRR